MYAIRRGDPGGVVPNAVKAFPDARGAVANAIKPGENLNPVKTLLMQYDEWREGPAGLVHVLVTMAGLRESAQAYLTRFIVQGSSMV